MYAPTSHWSRPTNAAEQNDPQSSSDTFPPKHFQHSQGQDTAGKERSSSESDPQMDAFAPGATTYSGDVLDSIENYGPPKSPEQSASEDYAISRSERRPSDRYAADNNSHYDPATSQTEFERFVDEKVKKRMNLQSSSWNSGFISNFTYPSILNSTSLDDSNSADQGTRTAFQKHAQRRVGSSHRKN